MFNINLVLSRVNIDALLNRQLNKVAFKERFTQISQTIAQVPQVKFGML